MHVLFCVLCWLVLYSSTSEEAPVPDPVNLSSRVPGIFSGLNPDFENLLPTANIRIQAVCVKACQSIMLALLLRLLSFWEGL